ncbi:MAG: hypothetical protein RIS76_2459 [Verrucomicrobiota bacterium]
MHALRRVASSSLPRRCVSALIFTLLLFGCSRPADPEPQAATETASAAENEGPDETEIALTQKLEERRKAVGGKVQRLAPDKPVTKARTPSAGEQHCFQCEGLGTLPCTVPKCRDGFLPCTGPCLKRHEGTWVPDTKHGGMARAVKTPDRRTWFVPEGHAGEVWVFEGGTLVSKGNCPTCGGRRTLDCQPCGRTGRLECESCEGTGVVPGEWKEADNPWFNRQPDVVRLKDGRAFLGREAGGDDVVILWKTRAGEIITVAREEVAQWPKK